MLYANSGIIIGHFLEKQSSCSEWSIMEGTAQSRGKQTDLVLLSYCVVCLEIVHLFIVSFGQFAIYCQRTVLLQCASFDYFDLPLQFDSIVSRSLAIRCFWVEGGFLIVFFAQLHNIKNAIFCVEYCHIFRPFHACPLQVAPVEENLQIVSMDGDQSDRQVVLECSVDDKSRRCFEEWFAIEHAIVPIGQHEIKLIVYCYAQPIEQVLFVEGSPIEKSLEDGVDAIPGDSFFGPLPHDYI